MAVESRFVVIRQGVEVETFMDKKSADEYDKMLDIADNLSDMFEKSPLALDEKLTEDLSIYLAKHKDDLLVALEVKKAKPAAKVKKSPKPVSVPVVESNVVQNNPTESDRMVLPASEHEAEETLTLADDQPIVDVGEEPIVKTRTRKKAVTATNAS